jgi:hypothetical protein
MKKILLWLESHIWPWSEIAALRKDVEKLRWERASIIEQYRDGYNSHWSNWVANANMLFGNAPFDNNQIVQMRAFYDEGESWRMAVDRLRMTMRLDPRDKDYFRPY